MEVLDLDVRLESAEIGERVQHDTKVPLSRAVTVLEPTRKLPGSWPDYLLWHGDVERLLDRLPKEPLFDLVVTSPPYNLGKPYETIVTMDEYRRWQARIIRKIVPRLKPTGSICWQVGNYVAANGGGERGSIHPLDFLFHPLFEKHGLTLRNRIVWRFGHGLHSRYRFSGRYEVVLWYTVGHDYTFNLDDVRVPSKYPGKKAYKGPNAGQYSSNPLGKNPEDVWEIPNVKGNHIEKTDHPCQFPVGLIERLVLALTNPGDLVFDPFAGVSSSGVAAAVHGRRFWGSEMVQEYVEVSTRRLENVFTGHANYRPHDKPIYDHTKSKLSQRPPLIEEKEVGSGSVGIQVAEADVVQMMGPQSHED